MEKKKIIMAAAAILVLVSFSSCGKSNKIDGKWKFDDGSTISFNTKSGTYTAKGTANSTEGDFELMKCGTLTTVGTNSVPEDYRIMLTDSGFEIDFKGSYLTFKGKAVKNLGDLNGKYQGKLGERDIEFSFSKKSSGLVVSIDVNGEKISDTFSYSLEPEDRIYFTSGMYATGDTYLVDYIDSKTISIDGSVLTR